MKFDRSMTEYNEIVGASIYCLLGGEAEKLHAANPILSAAARILKENHGTAYHGCAGLDGIDVKSTPQGMKVNLSRFFPDIDDKTLILGWSDVAKLIKDDSFYAEYIHAYKPAKTSPSEQPKEQPETPQNVPALFDYSELPETEADRLRAIEQNVKTETASYFTILGANFKAAQELLANHSGGTFERWYTAMGFKRQTVYRLIQRFEFMSSPTVGEQKADIFEELPLKLSYEISKPSAPPKLVERVLSGGITSHADYQKLKKELEEAGHREEKLKNDLERCKDDLRIVEHNFEEREKLRIEAGKENTELRLKIKELESRPVEVATQVVEKIPDDCVTRRAYEEMVTNYTNQLAKSDEECLAEKRRAYEEKQQLEQKIAELENGTQSNPEDEFRLLCQICRHPLLRLALFVSKHPLYKSRLDGFIAENTAIAKEEK